MKIKMEKLKFVVMEGASATSNNGCEAVRNLRDNHIK